MRPGARTSGGHGQFGDTDRQGAHPRLTVMRIIVIGPAQKVIYIGAIHPGIGWLSRYFSKPMAHACRTWPQTFVDTCNANN